MADLPKSYNHNDIEPKWYQFWEKGEYFKADPNSTKPPFCLVIPPPNVTGALHMGHALVNTLQDVLVRWKRMLGFEALWVPGTDHAGIATQTVVERHLMATEGKRRKDYSREEFLKRVWQWKESHESRIINQLKQLGCSCDWDKQRFTMDEGCNAAVRKVFKKMYDEGLIYRGDYLVNWDPVTQTALADDEVEYEERQSFLWYFKYPLVDSEEYITVATTRPETMLGDTAVAVSPKDERYQHLIGQHIELPLTGRHIAIIADHRVDPEFGTGAVKITPAHDPNDYQMGLEHNLDFINIMTPNGHINENGREFQGLTMPEARQAVIEKLKQQGLLLKIEPHQHRVGVSYRSKADIEPYMSKQWFVRMSGMAKLLSQAVRDDEVSIIPQNWEQTYFHWVDNLRDWCISRQLWWGHRIPIWYNKDHPEEIICFDGEGLPPEVEAHPEQWRQDEDVLDTWFSSALWPFSAIGWPEESPLLDKFYPNSILVTGHDILFFWVARMIAVGKYVMGEFPFEKVFLHGLIYGKSYWRQKAERGIEYVSSEERIQYDLGAPTPSDVQGRWEKMSKSKGNIIDPLELITQYGTDAVRMALCATPSQLRQIDLDRRKFEEYKNFANKVWNGARFVFMNLEDLTADEFAEGIDFSILTLEDRWMLSTLNRINASVNKHLENLLFDHAATAAYEFFWKEFCAYYVELSKPYLFSKTGSTEQRKNKQKILAIILCNAIRLLHPMTPYITEELFQQLKNRLSTKINQECDRYTQESLAALQNNACTIANYPLIIEAGDIRSDIEADFDLIRDVIYTIRNIRGEMKLKPSDEVQIFISGEQNEPQLATVKDNANMIKALTKASSLEFSVESPKLPLASTALIGNLQILIPLPQEMHSKELERLQKEKERLQKGLEKAEKQLNNPNFVEKAPAELVQKQHKQLQQLQKELQEVDRKLS
ncbi:MAG: valine--tRNA ligase [Chlamydiota bacterium]